MDAEKKKIEIERRENDIVYSRAIKAGKRIYYLDVKRSRNNDLFLAITESKKKVTGTDDDLQVLYEKHKIFLYKEDFDKFAEGLEDVIGFIKREIGDNEISGNVAEPQEEVAEPQEEEDTKSKGFFDKFKF